MSHFNCTNVLVWLLILWMTATVGNGMEGLISGMRMMSYKEGDRVALDVNVLTSAESPVSYNFYQQQLGFCDYPEKVLKSHGLGAIMFGDRIYSSPFEIRMLESMDCRVLCRQILNKQQISFLTDKIRLNYTHNWLIDQLPVAQPYQIQEDVFYRLGFPLGAVIVNMTRPPEVILHNHYSFTIEYHKVKSRANQPLQYRVVGALIEPRSIHHLMDDNGKPTCPTSSDTITREVLSPDLMEIPIHYGYSVKWIENKNISWATRWDQYLKIAHVEVHWYSMVLPFSIVLVMTVLVAAILMRTLKLDLYKYNRIDLDTIQDETGWKLVSTEVLRPPRHCSIFCACIGSGAHILCMTAVMIGRQFKTTHIVDGAFSCSFSNGGRSMKRKGRCCFDY